MGDYQTEMNESSEERIISLESQNSDLSNENYNLREERERNYKDARDWQHQFRQRDREYDDVKMDLEDRDREIKNLENDLERAATRIADLEYEVRNLEAEIRNRRENYY